MAKKVLMAMIKQETNGFKRITTKLDEFVGFPALSGHAVFDRFTGTNLELGGFIKVAEEEGWELIPSAVGFAPPSGPVEDEAFEVICACLMSDIKDAMPLDGVLLSMHGSMVVQSFPDSEAEISRRVRQAVGPDVPIFVSLDPHCNISEDMADLVEGMMAFRTSPHIDQAKTGERTARMLAETLRRKALPDCVLMRLPMLFGFDGARTYHDFGPFLDAIKKAEGYEADPDILGVSIHAGFFAADSAVIGPSVAVSGYAPQERLRQIAAEMMAFCWENRDNHSDKISSIEDAAAAIRARKPGDKPVILGDYGDSPAGGAYGDATSILSLLFELGVTNAVFGALYDPQVVEEAAAAGEGATVHLSVGGKLDPDHGGGPVEGDWTVVVISDGNTVFTGPYGTGTQFSFGKSVLIERDGVQVMVTSTPKGMFDQSQLRLFGIEPSEKDVLVLKSMQAYRGDFQHLASVCLDVDSGGISSPNPKQYQWKNVPRPIWPLDEVEIQIAS